MAALKRHTFESGAEHWRLGPGVSVEQAMLALKDDPRVEYAEPNMIGEFTKEPSDDYYSDQTQLPLIQMPQAWDLTTGSNAVIIAVIDSGIDPVQQDLVSNIRLNNNDPLDGLDNDGNGYVDDYKGWDFKDGDNDPTPANGHGTSVAGIIGAKGIELALQATYGIAGINWNVKLMNLSVGPTAPNVANVTQAVDYARKNGAHIINMSLALPCAIPAMGGCSTTLGNAIQAAGDRDVIVIAAAGNDGTNVDDPNYPGRVPVNYDLPNIITVAATNLNDTRKSDSSWGAVSVDVAAPGNGIYTDVPLGFDQFPPVGDGIIGDFAGTSAATPHVAGLAGLIKALSPNIPFDLIKARILDATSLDQVHDFRLTGPNPILTGGRINAYETLDDFDSVSPTPITSLAAVYQTSSSVTLTWYSTGDDGMIGPATVTKLRISTAPITELNWLLATLVDGGMVPGNPGTQHTKVVYNLQRSKTYYFALKTYDEWGNGPLSNVVSRTTCGMTQNSFCKYIEIRCWATDCGSSGCFYYGNCDNDLTCILAEECPPGTCSVHCPN